MNSKWNHTAHTDALSNIVGKNLHFHWLAMVQTFLHLYDHKLLTTLTLTSADNHLFGVLHAQSHTGLTMYTTTSYKLTNNPVMKQLYIFTIYWSICTH